MLLPLATLASFADGGRCSSERAVRADDRFRCECSNCGLFGVCASNVCDQSKTTTCGCFCGDAK